MACSEGLRVDDSVGRAKCSKIGRQPLDPPPAGFARARAEGYLAQLTGFRIAHAIVTRWISPGALAIAQHVDDLDLVTRAEQAAQRLLILAGGPQEVGDQDRKSVV